MAIHHKDSKINIVLDKSVLKWSLFGLLVVLLVFSFYLYRKKQTEWMETSYRLHRASRRTLDRYIRSISDIADSKGVLLDRLRKARKLLGNNRFDDEVIIVRCQTLKVGSHWPTISLGYVDEKLRVAFVKYISEKSQSHRLEFTFVDPNGMPPPGLRMWGVTDLLLSLREDANLPADGKPFLVQENQRWYFVCPEPFYKSILKRQGRFILLDRANNILDQATLQELYVPERKMSD